MALGSGLAGQLMGKKETTYGTRVVPTNSYEINSENVNLTRNRLKSAALRAGRTTQASARVVTTTRQGAGPVNLDVVSQGMGFWFDLLHGNAVTPVQQGATAAYLQTHNLYTSDPNKSATVQVGKPGTAGTVQPFDYLGSMVTQAVFSCAVDGFLTSEYTLDVQDRVTNQTLATWTPASNLHTFHFGQVTITLNSVNITDVFSGFTLTIPLGRKTDRFYLGASGLKAKPIQNAVTGATVTLDGDFKDLTNLGLYDADTIFPLVIEIKGPLIASTFFEDVKFTMTACQIDGEDPNLAGPDVLTQPLSISVLDDNTNPPIKLEYTSIDTAAL